MKTKRIKLLDTVALLEDMPVSPLLEIVSKIALGSA